LQSYRAGRQTNNPACRVANECCPSCNPFPEVPVRGWVKGVFIVVVLPILIGGIVLLVAGRRVVYELLQRRIAGRFPTVQWIAPEELALWREDPGRTQPVVLDARTEDEFDTSHLRGAIRIDPYRPSTRPLARFPKDTPIVVSSSAGYRSARVAVWLRRAGYGSIQNLTGGLFRWVNEGRPVFRDDRPTQEVHPYDRYWGWLLKGRYRAQAPDIPKQSAAP
jgi:rhodanese-related sulfurtransferase